MRSRRRTVGTCMNCLVVPKDVRERILNHGGSRKGSITDGVYNHYEYDAEVIQLPSKNATQETLRSASKARPMATKLIRLRLLRSSARSMRCAEKRSNGRRTVCHLL